MSYCARCNTEKDPACGVSVPEIWCPKAFWLSVQEKHDDLEMEYLYRWLEESFERERPEREARQKAEQAKAKYDAERKQRVRRILGQVPKGMR